jgi:hypothetical protein
VTFSRRLIKKAAALVHIAALAAIVAATLPPAPALGDGDPASDVLIGQNVFYPFNRPVAADLQKTLNAETAAASHVHFPIKVALIASPEDLGAIPSLFGKPQQYADFLDQEISFVGTTQPLLVVMPGGYGVHGLNRPATLAVASLARPAGAPVDDLARAAIGAVRKLAAAAGRPIPDIPGSSGTATSAGGGTSGVAAEAGVAAVAFVAVISAAAVLWFRRRRARVR